MTPGASTSSDHDNAVTFGSRDGSPEDGATATSMHPSGTDPLLLALARYVQALHARYPGGPSEMHRAGLAGGANMPTMADGDDTAA
jgi:hypothetical protein